MQMEKLFPFLAVSTLLLRLGFGELAAPWLAGLMEPLFRVDGAGSSALLLGLVGGYPIGPRTTADLYRQGSLRKDEAERLLTFSNNSNPVFLISVLGIGVFGSVRVGIWLWLIHVLSALLTGLCFRRYRASSPVPQAPARGSAFHTVSFSAALVESVRAACSGILSVCAFVLFFYVLARPLSALASPLGPVLVGATELFSLTPLLTADRFGFCPLGGGQRLGRAVRPLPDGGRSGGQRPLSPLLRIGKTQCRAFSPCCWRCCSRPMCCPDDKSPLPPPKSDNRGDFSPFIIRFGIALVSAASPLSACPCRRAHPQPWGPGTSWR